MSATATAAAWGQGDYRGARFVVLLAVADVVNDAHENEFFMRMARLAAKARVDRKTAREALATFAADGWLEVLDDAVGNRAGRYRWVGPPAGERGATPHSVGSHAPQDAAAPIPGTKGNSPAPATGDDSVEADRIVREWWESHDPRPLGSFPGCRKIVQEALERGHAPARVAVALRRCGNAVPSKPVLARELARGGGAGAAARPRPEGYDQAAPEGGRSW